MKNALKWWLIEMGILGRDKRKKKKESQGNIMHSILESKDGSIRCTKNPLTGEFSCDLAKIPYVDNYESLIKDFNEKLKWRK